MGARPLPRLTLPRALALLSGVACALVLLAATATANAATGTVTREGTTIKVDFGAGDAAGGVVLTTQATGGNAGTIQLVHDTGLIVDEAENCTLISGSRVDCAVAGATRLLIELGEGDDFTEFIQFDVPVEVEIHGEGGDDPQLWGSENDDTILGGPGDDELDSFAGDDVLDGGDGDDVLSGQAEADDISGGAGFDVVDFSGVAPGVTVKLNDLPDDGHAAEGDNVHSDVEDVDATSGPDVIEGSAAANVLRGLGGNDRVTGGGGSDSISTGQGDDVVSDRDGAADRVDCGDGADSFTGDVIDAAEGCESQQRSPELQVDVDGDGAARPADCNDADPAIRPGAAEILDDGIDQNCDGPDATNLDRDGDGVPRPVDCDDGDAKAAPGKRERRGNRRDEDCNGRAEPFAVVDNGVPNVWSTAGPITRNLRLGVRDVRRGMRIELRCSGGGCPFAERTRTVRRNARLLDLHPLLADARFRAGARLELRIRRSGAIGKVVRYTFRTAAAPRSTALCLRPGARRPRAC